MRLMHYALALILCTAVFAARASAHEPVDWKQAHFGGFERTFGGISVRLALEHLTKTPEYIVAFDRKQYWSCIRLVLVGFQDLSPLPNHELSPPGPARSTAA